MKKNLVANELLISAIKEELPQLSEKEQLKIAEILSKYIPLLDEGRIEEAYKLIRNNHKQLAKMI